MVTKMRVRELSAELGISNKELLQLLRSEHIQAKSHMSGLTAEQVELIKNKFKEVQGKKQTEDKITPSGIIVRRRRKKATQPDKTSEETAQVPTGQSASKAANSLSSSQSEGESTKSAIKEEAKPQEMELAPGQEEQETMPAQSKTKDIHPAPQSEPKSAPKPDQMPKKTNHPASPAELKVKQAKERKKKKKKTHPAPPFVTIISKPAPQSDQRTTEVAAGKAADIEQPAIKPTKGKRKKGKRVVDVSTLYPKQEPGRPAKNEWKKKKSGPVKDKTRGKAKHRRAKEPKVTGPEVKTTTTQPLKASKRKIRMEEAIRVADLAQEMGVKAQEIIKILLNLGVMATINQSLDLDTASIVAAEFGYEVEKTGFSEEEFLLPQQEDRPEELRPRPPVVTIMGHVDHGKTSLLDAIRRTHVAEREAGGITQHIGAYHVKTKRGMVVFLDTPGHEAFTEMRSRGAQVTDIVVLIVAADDGVMDQTKEAISHAKAAGVPIIVAINKIDKENADPERVKRELADHGLIPEDWGGETIFCNISAKNRIGIDELLEMILLQAEVLDLKANPNKRATGHIIEARLDKGRGPVATVLIQSGTLKTADAFVCGLYHGRVRALFDDRGKKIKEAGPAVPVEVQGFNGVPNAGDEFVVVENDKVAKKIAEERQLKHREKELAKETKVSLESFFAAKAEDEIKTLNLILKTDVQGSLEAITESLRKINTDVVKVEVIHGGIGAISEGDVKLAAASSAVIIGFNVRPSAKVKDLAEKEGVDIRFYDVIYHLVNEVKEAMSGMLAPVTKEVYLGQAEVRETFNVPKVGTIAGCFVLDGKLQRNAGIRLLRDGVVIYTGKLNSLKRFKDDVKEVVKDYECGVGLENFNDIKIGDVIEAFEEIQEKATLN